MKKYKTGLVVGKFCPFHKGHAELVKRAGAMCDKLVIISYTSEFYAQCDATQRARWIKDFTKNQQILSKVIVIDPNIEPIPKDTAGEAEHRSFCASLLDRYYVSVDVVFSSEDYGDGFADFLSDHFGFKVHHELFDKKRVNVAISGTALRANFGLMKNLSYVPHTTTYDCPKRIVLLGGESSGKSTLAVALAAREYLNCQVVKEYGREFCEQNDNIIRIQDYLHIAITQISHENLYGNNSGSGYLVCDTSPLTTYFYSLYSEGKADPKLKELSTRSYYKTYVCAPDIPFVQDESRKNEKFRQLQHEWYLAKLHDYKMPFLVVHGTVEERLEQIMQDLQY